MNLVNPGEWVAHADRILSTPCLDTGVPFDTVKGVDEALRATSEVQEILAVHAAAFNSPLARVACLLSIAVSSLAVCLRDLQNKESR